jgi:hypothetical protein
MSNKIIALASFALIQMGVIAQNVGINATGANPNASAMLDVNSNNKGVLVPNISLTGKTSAGPIASPATSLLVYNIATAGSGVNQVTPGYHYWDGAQWIRIYDDNVNATDHDWYEVGGTSSPDNIIDDIFTQGDVGIGTTTPDSKLQVVGDIRVGELHPANTGTYPNYGDKINFSGGPSGTTFNSDNSDPIWLSRYNILSDQSELRVNLGDNIQAADKFHIGTTNGGAFVTHAAVTAEGRFGIQTDAPRAFLDVSNTSLNQLKSVLARLPEGNATGNGTYLGVTSEASQPVNVTSFSIQHRFYNVLNGSIDFERGAGNNDGYITFNTLNNIERMRIESGGNVGIGADDPQQKLHIIGNQRVEGSFVEIGAGLTGNRNVFTDYVGDDTYTDYGLRIIRANTGANAFSQITHRGTGILTIGAEDAGQVRFRTNNADRMTILPTTGNVGIGITNPEEKLVVNGITRFIGQTTTDDSNLRIHTEYGTSTIGNLSALTGGSDRHYRILTEANYIAPNRDWWIFDALDGNQAFSDGGIEFRTTGGTAGVQIPLMTIEGTGQIGIGTNVPGYQLQLSTNSAAKPTSASWTVASDQRLKTDVNPFMDGMNIIDQINPVWFTYNGKAGMPTDTGVGTIAQELQKIAPYMVKSWEYFDIEKQASTEYLGVDYGAMDFVLINALKEQQTEIDTLKNEILELKKLVLELAK